MTYDEAEAQSENAGRNFAGQAVTSSLLGVAGQQQSRTFQRVEGAAERVQSLSHRLSHMRCRIAPQPPQDAVPVMSAVEAQKNSIAQRSYTAAIEFLENQIERASVLIEELEKHI